LVKKVYSQGRAKNPLQAVRGAPTAGEGELTGPKPKTRQQRQNGRGKKIPGEKDTQYYGHWSKQKLVHSAASNRPKTNRDQDSQNKSTGSASRKKNNLALGCSRVSWAAL